MPSLLQGDPTMTDKSDKPEVNDFQAEVENFILTHRRWFTAPYPTGLGYDKPGLLPDMYLKNPKRFLIDSQEVLDRIATSEREKSRANTKDTMDPEVLDLINQISELRLGDYSIADISRIMSMPEICIRNALAIGPAALRDQDAEIHNPGSVIDDYLDQPRPLPE